MGLASLLENTIMRVIIVVIVITLGVALGPTLASALADINSTSMADVFLGDIVVTMADFIMFFYYLSLILGGMATVWKLFKMD